jgi:UDP-N-acetylglucosamine 2-epimerase (non-hydrolysing)
LLIWRLVSDPSIELEEINRIVTDSIADILWTHSPEADENLLREGIAKEKIERVGNIMIDSLEMVRPRIKKMKTFTRYGLNKGHYGLVTIHRPSNVDRSEKLKHLCNILSNIAAKVPLFFPVHPRTLKNLESNNQLTDLQNTKGLYISNPLNYTSFMNLLFNCRFVITDSGGLQEETTYLGIPCLTLRPNTERPITITHGSNRLCKMEDLENNVIEVLEKTEINSKIPEFWDGQAANRVVNSISKFLYK